MSSSTSGASGFGTNDDSIRAPLDPHNLPNDASEYSWGSGLVPPDLENAPPSEGGMYQGTSPECSPQIGIHRR